MKSKKNEKTILDSSDSRWIKGLRWIVISSDMVRFFDSTECFWFPLRWLSILKTTKSVLVHSLLFNACGQLGGRVVTEFDRDRDQTGKNRVSGQLGGRVVTEFDRDRDQTNIYKYILGEKKNLSPIFIYTIKPARENAGGMER